MERSLSRPTFDTRPTAQTPAHYDPDGAVACVHHWDVATRPRGGAFPASCRRCGADRTFPLITVDAPPTAARPVGERLPALQLPLAPSLPDWDEIPCASALPPTPPHDDESAA